MARFSQQYKLHLREILTCYLKGELDIQNEHELTCLLLDECYLDMCRHFDSSFIIDQINYNCAECLTELEKIASDNGPISNKDMMDELVDFIDESTSQVKFFSRREDTFFREFCESSDCVSHYISMLKNIRDSTSQILCKKNAQSYWDSIDKKIEEVFKKLQKDNLNQMPERNQRFMKDEKHQRFELEKSLKCVVNHFRRFLPEMK